MMTNTKDTPATLVIGREYHSKLKKLAKQDKRGLRDYVEVLIERMYSDTKKSS